MPFHRKRRLAAKIAASLQQRPHATLAETKDSSLTVAKLPLTISSVAVISAVILGLPQIAEAKPAKKPAQPLYGVTGWTSGSQTYIRARPGTETPPVAKVGKHTQLHVWGKYNGWYRVETPDHHFGWVFNEYVNVKDEAKLVELSHKKAAKASDRTADQKMYGSPALLKKHYEVYKAAGAAKGLRDQGIKVAVARPKPAKKAAVQIAANNAPKPTAKTRERPAAVAARPVAAPQAIAASQPAMATRSNLSRPAAPMTTEWSLDGAAPRLQRNTSLKTPQTAHSTISASRAAAPEVEPIETTAVAPVTVPAATSVAATAPVVAAAAPEPLTAPRASVTDAPEANRTPVAARPATKARPARGGGNVPRKGTAVKAPPVADPNTLPITPEDLLKARDEFLGPRDRNAAPAASATPAASTPTAADTTATVSNAVVTSETAVQARIQPIARTTRTNRKPARVKKATAAGTPNRGGSPRDYARYASANFGQNVANMGLTYRGMPYIRGASSPNSGFDCSGFVNYLLRRQGLKPPRTASDFGSYGKSVARGDLQPGDILLFSNTYKHGISHVGIYIGNNNFVHAANSSRGVTTDSLGSGYYAGKFSGARRAR